MHCVKPCGHFVAIAPVSSAVPQRLFFKWRHVLERQASILRNLSSPSDTSSKVKTSLAPYFEVNTSVPQAGDVTCKELLFKQ